MADVVSSAAGSPATITAGSLRIRLFADGADRDGILALARDPLIQGFTTNPTLMHAAGIRDYETFAREVLEAVPDMPISFEVFADDFDEMERQARIISTWGESVYVKIPITNTRGDSAAPLVARLAAAGVRLNVTAMLLPEQVEAVAGPLAASPSAFVSVFAGRIADSGRDPVPYMVRSLEIIRDTPHIQLIWASPRELLNIVQADAIGCHVITVTHDLLRKLPSLGRDLRDFSLDTVRMFHRDAQAAGFRL